MPRKKTTVPVPSLTNLQKRGAVLAGLRLLQQYAEGKVPVDVGIEDIQTNAGAFDALDAQGIAKLFEELNGTPEPEPVRVIIHLEGGLVQAVHSSVPVDYAVADHDVSSDDEEAEKEELMKEAKELPFAS